MIRKVEAFIEEYSMLETGDRVIAAVSGGADSVCLFHLLYRLRERWKLRLLAVHVHHGLRGAEADRDEEFVKNLAESLGVPFVAARIDVSGYARERGLSVEEAGRILRYQSLREQAALFSAPESEADSGRVRIAVAHQKEDQAETILHNLFRGSSLKGLSGMAPVSGDIIRPLLCAGRQEIMDYLKQNGLEYCEDSTNSSPEYTRNRIRRMLPLICGEINSGAVEHILAAGRRVAQADAYFEKMADALWLRHGVAAEVNDEVSGGADTGVTDTDGAGANASDAKSSVPGGCVPEGGAGKRCGISSSFLSEQPDIMAGYLVMKMIKLLTGSVRDITSVHIEQTLELAGKGTGRRICLPGGLQAVKEYDMLWLENRSGMETSYERSFSFQRFPYKKNLEIPQNRYTKWFDYDKIKGELSVRTRQAGDYITLKDGGRKTVKAFMIDEKIPRGARDKILLLAEGSHVLWIVGYRISEYYKVTDRTREILQARADGGREGGGENSGAVV